MKAIIRHNTTQNGIEIKFDGRPDSETIAKVKSIGGFRWSRRNKLWYAKYSDYRWRKANDYFGPTGTPNPPAPEPPKQKTEAEKLQSLKNHFEVWKANHPDIYKYAKMNWVDFISYKPYQIEVASGVYQRGKNRGETWQVVWTWNNNKNRYEHTPEGRKRPDTKDIANLHYLLMNIALKNGAVIPFETYFSNPVNNNAYSRDLSSIKRIIKDYPQQKQAPDYKEYLETAEKAEAELEYQRKKWETWKKNHFKKGQTIYYFDKSEKKYIPVQIESLDADYFYKRQDLIEHAHQKSFVRFILKTPVDKLYLESPDKNPSAKSLIELYPIDEDVVDIKPEKPAEERISLNTVKKLMPKHQQQIVFDGGQLQEAHKDTLIRLEKELSETPTTGKTTKTPLFERTVHIHYFYGRSDWFITEWDRKYNELWGYVILNGDLQMSEYGPVSVDEITNTPPIELDFYWKKKPLGQALYEHNKDYFSQYGPEEEKQSKSGLTDQEWLELEAMALELESENLKTK